MSTSVYMRGCWCALTLAVILVSGADGVLALPSDQTTVRAGLQRFHEDLYFLDTAITNLPEDGTEADMAMNERIFEAYRQSMQREYHAQLWFVRSEYGKSHAELYKAQTHLSNAYEMMLSRYLLTAMAILDETSPAMVGSRDPAAKHYIQEGFRSLERGRLLFQRGTSIDPRLKADQIRLFREGILHVRIARRFAILALIEANLNREEKERFRTIDLDEYANRDVRETRDRSEGSYDRVRYWLLTLIDRGVIERRLSTVHLPDPRVVDLLEVHEDNFNRMMDGRLSRRLRLAAEIDPQLFYNEQVMPFRTSDNRADVTAEESDPRMPRAAGE